MEDIAAVDLGVAQVGGEAMVVGAAVVTGGEGAEVGMEVVEGVSDVEAGEAVAALVEGDVEGVAVAVGSNHDDTGRRHLHASVVLYRFVTRCRANSMLQKGLRNLIMDELSNSRATGKIVQMEDVF